MGAAAATATSTSTPAFDDAVSIGGRTLAPAKKATRPPIKAQDEDPPALPDECFDWIPVETDPPDYGLASASPLPGSQAASSPAARGGTARGVVAGAAVQTCLLVCLLAVKAASATCLDTTNPAMAARDR